ncbi:MAG: glycosyltransferase family 4 protein [Candidatus Diapherotrites archaeon]
MAKIAILCPRTPRLYSAGIETSVIHVGDGLKKAGFEVEIFTTAKKPEKNACLNGIPIHEFPAFAPSDAYFFSPQLYFAVKKSRADIIHCNGYNNLVTLLGMLAKKKNQRLIVTLNSSGPSSAFRKLLWSPYSLLFNLFSKKADFFVCVSKFELEIFSKKISAPRERFVFIPNGVDIDFIKSVKAGKKGNYLISIGRLVKNKGFHHILKAFPKVLEEFPSLRLKIVGEGPYKKELERMAMKLGILEKVDFEPWIPFSRREDLVRLLKKARAFVFLSAYESQGIVVSEAIAAGTPCIVTENSGLKEFVENSGALGVKNPENSEEVSEKIILVMKNPKKFKPKKETVWSWKKVIQTTVKEFKKLQPIS